jgi:hypothetical protein
MKNIDFLPDFCPEFSVFLASAAFRTLPFFISLLVPSYPANVLFFMRRACYVDGVQVFTAQRSGRFVAN